MKKREVKPFLQPELKATLQKISFVTKISIMSLAEDLCNHAFKEGLGNELSSYFVRDIQIDGKMFYGREDAKKFDPYSNDVERITLSLNKNAYNYAYDLKCATESSVAKIVAYAITKSFKDVDFMDHYFKYFLVNKLDEDKNEKVLDIVRMINDVNVDEEFSIASLLLYIADENRRFDVGLESVLKDVYS